MWYAGGRTAFAPLEGGCGGGGGGAGTTRPLGAASARAAHAPVASRRRPWKTTLQLPDTSASSEMFWLIRGGGDGGKGPK